MGTTRSGAYINTKGSGKRASDFAVIHSIEGDFTKQLVKINGKKVTRLRLTNGGHGQRGIELLKKYGIKYNIVKTYPNGVRAGNIPNHKIKKKRSGISQSWFPTNWNRKQQYSLIALSLRNGGKNNVIRRNEACLTGTNTCLGGNTR